MARGIYAFLGAALIAVGGLMAEAPMTPAAAQDYAQPKKKKGIKGTIGYRRAYSYSKADVVGSDNRRFYDPGYTRQTPGGPFDNGFFFDSGIGLHAGDSPYQQ